MAEFAVALHWIKHCVTASGESIYLLPFVRKVPDRHYPLTAIPPSSPTISAFAWRERKTTKKKTRNTLSFRRVSNPGRMKWLWMASSYNWKVMVVACFKTISLYMQGESGRNGKPQWGYPVARYVWSETGMQTQIEMLYCPLMRSTVVILARCVTAWPMQRDGKAGSRRSNNILCGCVGSTVIRAHCSHCTEKCYFRRSEKNMCSVILTSHPATLQKKKHAEINDADCTFTMAELRIETMTFTQRSRKDMQIVMYMAYI
jgi:hypothetical protein